MPPTLLFILLLMLTFAIAFYFLRPTKTESAVQQHLEEIKDSREDASLGPTILREEGYSTNPAISEFVQLIPGALGTLNLMARGLRAGHALTAVLEMVGNESPEPIGSEFKRLHEETALGLPLRDATTNLVSRIPRDDVRFLATAILLQKETGGNLAIILDKNSAVARERARLRGQLMIYTAQGRVTGWILCIMPFFMFGVLSLLNWNTEKILFTDEMGLHAVYGGLFLMVLGILTIRKIIDIKV